MKLLEVDALSVSYGTTAVLKNLCFTLEEGQWLMVTGPNGAGKSTLLKAVSGGLAYSGRIRLAGQAPEKIKPRLRAQQVALLTQRHQAAYSYTVEEVVAMGRYAYSRGMLADLSPADKRMIEISMVQTGILSFAQRPISSLSGGELQRVFLAQVFAQDPKLLLLDEPANHLDVPYQRQLFAMLAAWIRQPGRGIISVVHDLSLARAFGSHGLLLKAGECISYGDKEKAFLPEHLERAYEMDVRGWMRNLLSKWE